MKDVTFAIHFGDHSDDHATHEHLDPLHKSLEHASKKLKNLYSEVKFAVGRQDSHNHTIEQSLSKNVWVVILETLCILLLAAAQVFFIKRVLNNKRVI